MIAVSSLSLYRQGVDQHTDPSLYCQQAFSSLQASMSEDKILLSDGNFLAHFLILVFEVRFERWDGSGGPRFRIHAYPRVIYTGRAN